MSRELEHEVASLRAELLRLRPASLSVRRPDGFRLPARLRVRTMKNYVLKDGWAAVSEIDDWNLRCRRDRRLKEVAAAKKAAAAKAICEACRETHTLTEVIFRKGATVVARRSLCPRCVEDVKLGGG